MNLSSIATLAFLLTTTPIVQHGDVVASSARPDSPGSPWLVGTLVVFARDGQFKGELTELPDAIPSDPFVRDATIYVATRFPGSIRRFAFDGQELAPFGPADAVNFLAPGPNGGLLAVNGSCELYHFGPDGTTRAMLGIDSDPRPCGGVELAGDGCTVYFAAGNAIARWNACLDTAPERLPVALPHSIATLRLLPDRTLLTDAASDAPILRIDLQGNVIRNYGIRGNGLALDIDGTSFWTNEFGWISRVDIATGAVLTRTYHGMTWGLSVVGEPRSGLATPADTHAIPTASVSALAMLTIVLALFATSRLR